MPLYEYDCPKCGRIEVIQKFSDAPLSECPLCAKKGVVSEIKKCVSLTSFQLKGKGWYQTDYNGKNSCYSGGHRNDTTNTTTTKSPAPEKKSAVSPAVGS